MNQYMQAVGFGQFPKEKWNRLFEEVCKNPDVCHTYQKSKEETFFEMTKNIGKGMAITWSGSIRNGEMDCQACYPVAFGENFSVKESVNVEERVIGDAYTGAFDDFRSGVFIIFFLRNAVTYLEYAKMSVQGQNKRPSVALAGLAKSGTVLFPLAKTEQGARRKVQEQKQRLHLLAEARKGNEKAMESLAFKDMDIYTKVSRRIRTEDIFTIVESSFMPYGVECDLYSVVADIVEAEQVENRLTGEHIWKLKIDYNGIVIDVCINEKDLLGEPKAGRRFKGTIWLQGTIKYD